MIKVFILLISIFSISYADEVNLTGGEVSRIVLILIALLIIVSILSLIYRKIILGLGLAEEDKRRATGIRYTTFGTLVLSLLGLTVIYFLATSTSSLKEMIEASLTTVSGLINILENFIFPSESST